MSDITLSLCIAAGARPDFLDRLLGRLAEGGLPAPCEVVVSDASADGAIKEIVERRAAEGLPVVRFRHAGAAHRPGEPASLFAALRRGRGRYRVALAEDELPVPAALREAVDFLDAHPEVLACYAPWELHDDVPGAVASPQYALEADAVFAREEAMELFGFLVQHGVAPEAAVYRAEALGALPAAGRHCHAGFVGLARLIAEGAVAFQGRPFRRIATQDPFTGRRHDSAAAGASDWDLHRGGLEFFARALLARTGTAPDPAHRPAFRDAIDAYVETRMRLAFRVAMGRGDFLAAHEIHNRLSLLSLGEPRPPVEGLERLPLLVAVQTLARLANDTAEVERVVLVGVEDGPSISSLLRELGLERRILVAPPLETPSEKAVRGSLVFLGEKAAGERERLVAQGYAPSLVIDERDLIAAICLP
ncbi:hypothetical protein [Methylobacterium radiodurans]|uniref:Glycosyl transferase family 2 n=1 Tax=Methylobacterium radiodurans TaxID=2202828 RepID=A0A2U8VV30_9HYPH|nr:hypothetical protein [Methylobacterium radiodurans]AWN37643.1 hypothetical protein DK427_19510 [Methylobacterium radiodurans]